MSDSGARPAQAVQPLVEGQVVTGTLFSELMRVKTIRESGPGTRVVGFSGLTSGLDGAVPAPPGVEHIRAPPLA
jgi:hypothetical protein